MGGLGTASRAHSMHAVFAHGQEGASTQQCYPYAMCTPNLHYEYATIHLPHAQQWYDPLSRHPLREPQDAAAPLYEPPWTQTTEKPATPVPVNHCIGPSVKAVLSSRIYTFFFLKASKQKQVVIEGKLNVIVES